MRCQSKCCPPLPPTDCRQRLQVCRELKPRQLHALVMDAAVWLCCDDEVVHKLDTLCFGNSDGGPGTSAHVRGVLQAAGAPVAGDKSVRLSLDEAFFMHYALGILEVHDEVEGAAVALDTTVRCGGGRWACVQVRGGGKKTV